ncbi:MAG: 7-carboxy-7-deazaguanine synthase, partial [Sphingobium sp.]
LHAAGFTVAMESNGTIAAHPAIDWVCISPKAGSEVVQTQGDELKLVWPQAGLDPVELESWSFANRLVQPMDLGAEAANRDTMAACVDLVMERPAWRLSLQTHKLLGLR